MRRSPRTHRRSTRRLRTLRRGVRVLPGGFGTLDELFEALTLIQTGKISNFPVVLVGIEHWAGLVDWLRARLLEQSRVGPPYLALLHLTDDPTRSATS